MNRRDFLKITGGALAVGALQGCSRLLPQETVPDLARTGISPAAINDVTVIPDAERPNMLFILTDDLDAELGTTDYMPRLKTHLTEQGTSLGQFFTPTPVCCPSRISFLTGQYTHNHQVYMNAAPEGSFKKFNLLGSEASTIATWLNAAGYHTGYMGKYMNEYPFPDSKTYVPAGWDEWYSPAKGKPYTGFEYTLNENGSLVDYFEPTQYITDVLSDKADDFLRRAAGGAEPFFLQVSTYAPHEPYTPAPRHAEAFPDIQAPRTPSFNAEDVSDKPSNLRNNPPLTDGDIRDIDDIYRLRVQSMQAVDEMIERLMNTLAELNLLGNTYIFFISDNGFHMGQHRMKPGKAHPYEEDIRVPFIVRGPGIPAGVSVDDFLTANIDFPPTIAELAGVIPPAYVDGRSLLPLLKHTPPPADEWRQAVQIEFFGHQLDESGIVSPWYLGLRTRENLYVEHSEGFTELYDLIADPYQLDNLAPKTDPERLNALAAWLQAIYNSSGKALRAIEQNNPL